jgi:ATP-dependent DNA helicase RecG
MRPAILNPLFAEVTSLKGVGPALAKPLDRLGLARVVDVVFHLPTGWVDRVPREELDAADAGRIISIVLTPRSYRESNGRGPTRVNAFDAAGNAVSLTYFGGHPGWAKKLLPLGEPKLVSGRLDQYGQDLQIVHPELADPGEVLRAREPIYPLSEGVTSRRLSGFVDQASTGAPRMDRAGAEGEA